MSENLYAKRDHEAQGKHYLRHIDRMTVEKLHSKSAIAGELAHRDAEIAALRQDALRYQVLRDAPQQDQGIYVWDQRGEEYEECGRDLRGAELDAALDAAMAQAVQPS